MKGYDALAKALAAEGVEVVFGLIGGYVDDLIRVLHDQYDIRFIRARHEDVAVAMADGYSRATGKIGVAIVCDGPGLANSIAPMICARMSNSRLLVVVGGRIGVNVHDNQSYDQLPLLLASIGVVQQTSTPQALSGDVALAYRHVRLGRGPVALHFVIAGADMPADWTYEAKGQSHVPSEIVLPVHSDVEALCARLVAARRPVILAGRGAVLSGARDALLELADRSGALLATTLLAKNWFDDEPFNVGLSGGFAPVEALDVLHEADLVVAFGASLNDYTLAHGHIYSGASLVQIDIDPAAVNAWNPVALAIIADAKATAEAALLSLDAIRRPDWRGPKMATRLRQIDRWRGRDMTERPGTANPRRVVDALDRLAPKDRILVVDIGLFMGPPAAYMTVPSPEDIVFPWQLGRMGCGLGIALGAAVGRPDRLVTAFLGDGGFMAALNALDTLQAADAPMLVIVMDDGGYGAERHLFSLKSETTTVADYVTPDLPMLARSLGVRGYRVTSAAEMEALLSRGDFRHARSLIQVVMDRQIHVEEMDAAIYKAASPLLGADGGLP